MPPVEKAKILYQATTQNKERYLVWLKQADFDIQAAKVSREKGFYEWASFQSEQALEKTLKAVLVHAGWRPPKIHKLGVLMGLCNDANPDFAKIKIDFHTVDSYTFVARYPFLIPGQSKSPHETIREADADECIEIVSKALEAITTLLKHTGPIKLRDMIVPKFTKNEVNSRLDIVVDALVRNFDVDKIILFGSFARNKERDREKTMDILIVANTTLPFFERIKVVRKIIRGGEPIIEPLVYTQQELDQLLNEEGEGFLESAIDEGITIYSRGSKLVDHSNGNTASN